MDKNFSYYYVAEKGFDNLFDAGVIRKHHESIMNLIGFTPLHFTRSRKKNLISFFLRSMQLLRFFIITPRKSFVYFHFPVHAGVYKWLLVLLKWRNVKTVAIIIDIDGLRDKNDHLLKREINWLKQFTYLVVHNASMSNFLSVHLPGKSMFSINLFDYLTPAVPNKRTLSNTICIAGNFSKAGYVYHLKADNAVSYYLYGPGYDASKQLFPVNIYYKGVIAPEVLPAELTGSFGLVWDGDSPRVCDDYLRYNNPHKLSLYLVAGIPVIVWEQSAVADFIIKQNAGFTISCLSEIQEKLAGISEVTYNNMQQQAAILGKDICDGRHLKKVITEITKYNSQ